MSEHDFGFRGNFDEEPEVIEMTLGELRTRIFVWLAAGFTIGICGIILFAA